LKAPVVSLSQLSRAFRRRERGAGLKASLKSFIAPKWVEKVAVHPLSFEIPQGICMGLVGANGAGKTTLLKMIAGLLHPTSGSVRTLGYEPVKRDTAFLKSIGMVMGSKSQLWVDIPASETFELLAAIYEIPEPLFRERLQRLTTLLGVESILGVQVRRLSLGERMKCEIIASLLHDPELLILDEPTIGLDVVAKHAIRDFVKHLKREARTTVILSSHDMADIEELCDQLMVMDQGRLLYGGALEQFHRQYGTASGGERALENLVRDILTKGQLPS
jgi:ABC-2 type transport system ATP-binding protein